MPGPVTAAKSGVFIRPTPHLEATDTLAEWDALSGWVRIGGITNVGEFGPTYQEITSEPIDAEAVGKYKGMRNDGNLTLTIEWREDDAGQVIVRDALASFEDYDWKVELNNKPAGATSKPSRKFFAGKAMSDTFNIGGPNNLVTGTVNIAINGGMGAIVSGPRTVGA